MGVLSRVKEAMAVRCIRAALAQDKPAEAGVDATRQLRDVGSRRCVPLLKEVLAQGEPRLQAQAVRALGAIHRRQPNVEALEALNAAVLNERFPETVRQAAIETLAEAVDARHAGSLIEVLKRPSTPLSLRAAAIAALRRLGYAELLERLVECALLGPTLDPKGEARRWAIAELAELPDRDKLTKISDIIHGRRPLRYRAVAPDAGGPASLVDLLVQLDPKRSIPLLEHMLDEENPAIHAAAKAALDQLRQSDGR